MKKQWVMMALLAVAGLAANSFADVQNIRLSGDIRTRGYWLDRAAESDKPGTPNYEANSAFIEQRTRVSVEADLEDHVLVVVTLKAEGLWGESDQTSGSSGAGTEDDAGGAINRGWSTGVDEAYIQLNEMFYSPATLKLGRQYLNYGHGLILSSVDQEYNYDAGRLVLDYYPVTVDLIGGRVVDNGSFGGDSNHQSADLLFLNARYEMSDSMVKDIEAYFGWIAQSAHNGVSSSNAPPTLNGSSPFVLGVRGDLTPTDSVKAWFEAAYEGGADGTANNDSISAVLLNAGASYAFTGGWKPVIKANYTYASGGGKGQNVATGAPGQSTFRPWFDYAEGYNGYLFAPSLQNIHIFNVGVTSKPYENISLSCNVYYYLKADNDSFAGSNPNIDFGGLEYAHSDVAQSNSREIGWEIDNVFGYDYSKDVRFQLVNAFFIPAGAYRFDGPGGTVNSASHEVRGEVSVKF